MVRLGNIPTVSAYQGNAGQQMMQLGSRVGKYSEKLDDKAQKELEEAKNLYAQGLNISINNGINELRSNESLASNPTGLASAMDKVLEDTLKDVDDDDVKTAVMVDYQLKRGTYINEAQTAFNRIQRAKAKSYAFDTVYANIDTMGLSFANALTGNYTDDDVVNFQHSLEAIKANINAKNPDGTYMFTDEQRRAMMDDVQGSYLRGFKAIYEQLDEEQRKNVSEAVDNDSFELAQVSNKETPEEKSSIKLKDVVGEGSYKDIKNFITKSRADEAAAFMKQQKKEAEIAAYEYASNKTDENWKKLEDKVGLLSKDWKTVVENARGEQEEAAGYSTYSEAEKGIRDAITAKYNSDAERVASFANTISKIDGLQMEDGETADLYEKRKSDLKEMIISTMTNDARKKFFEKDIIPMLNKSLGWQLDFQRKMGWVERLKSKTPQWEQRLRKAAYMSGEDAEYITTPDVIKYDIDTLKEIFDDGNKLILETSMSDLDDNTKKEAIRKINEDTQRRALVYVYPDLDGKIVGSKITVNGEVYTITNMTDTVTLSK